MLKKEGKDDNKDLFRGLKDRAKKHSQPAPQAKIEISHLARQSKNQMLFDQQRQFQIQFDFEGLASEVHRERQNIYVDRPAFEILKTASIPTVINSSKHVYKSRTEHI